MVGARPRRDWGIAFHWIFCVRSSIGECNCRFLDALAGEFRGRGKESNVRHIIGESNYRFLDALAGECWMSERVRELVRSVGKHRGSEGLGRKCRLEVGWKCECRKMQRKWRFWRADGGWKCEAGAGHGRGHGQGMVGARPRRDWGIAFHWIFCVRSSIGECNCRFLDALAGEFRGRGKESNVRHIIGESKYRFLDALAGEFRGRGKESNVRRIIEECNCRVLDALSGGFRGCGKESK